MLRYGLFCGTPYKFVNIFSSISNIFANIRDSTLQIFLIKNIYL